MGGRRQERKRSAGKRVKAERQRQTTRRTKVIKKRGRGDKLIPPIKKNAKEKEYGRTPLMRRS